MFQTKKPGGIHRFADSNLMPPGISYFTFSDYIVPLSIPYDAQMFVNSSLCPKY